MIYTEITPNPATLKFVTDKKLLTRGTRDYPSPDTAEDSPLAKHLFQFNFVEAVFIAGNFVTVTKPSDRQWEELIPQIKEALKGFLESGQAAVDSAGDEAITDSVEEDDEIVAKIKQLLEDNVRPAVAMDGGDVVFDSFEEGVVKLRMQGSCSGCPSSTMTLKMGIEGLLTRMIPEVKEVQAVDA